MCNERTSGHPELWEAVSTLPEDRGPEGNLTMWKEAEDYFNNLCREHEGEGANEAILQALVDTYNRCIEERRRAEDLLKLHNKWASRRIGGVIEPDNPVRD